LTDAVGAKILIVEDDALVRKAVRLTCESENFVVEEVSRGGDALAALTKFRPDVVLLDIKLPDVVGFDVCREIRSAGFDTPVIILSAQNDEIDVVLGLEIGANDYVAKPFRPRELLARIAAQLRGTSAAPPSRDAGEKLAFGDLVILPPERRVMRAGNEIELTHTEFDLLLHMASHAGHVLSHENIFSAVWGINEPHRSRVLPVHVGNLRRKVEADATHPRFILTVPGIGYRFAQIPPT
jgi:two-component system response regulator MtrA